MCRRSPAPSRRSDLDLVVAAATTGGEATALLRRLRMVGCRAHFLVVTAEPCAEVRAAAAAAGALATLVEPVDAGLLLGFLRGRVAPAARPQTPDPADEPVDRALLDRLQELYATALPGRLTAIDEGARAGDAAALAAASYELAGTSAQVGHPEVAAVCRAIARDARRGVLAHHLVGELREIVSA
ncbi:MAG TPA: hypothetical protein VHF92_11280 [Geodermatophilus sp.]|nr:hypothetical protein [Geodermatophilus sp.]